MLALYRGFAGPILGSQLMSWRPCWSKANERISLTAIEFGACFPPTWPPCFCLVNIKRLIANHQYIGIYRLYYIECRLENRHSVVV